MNDKFTPDQKINHGICVLCAVLGASLSFFLDVTKNHFWIGGGIGLLVGMAISKFRPRYGQAKGPWKRINYFVLTQMDIESAFSKNKEKPNK